VHDADVNWRVCRADSAHMSTRLAEAPTLPKMPVKEKDRRRSERKPHVVEAWISSPTAVDPMDREEVKAVNLSRHGVGFDHAISLPLGTFHIIDIALGTQRLRTEVRIICCRKLGNGIFEIGAEFC